MTSRRGAKIRARGNVTRRGNRRSAAQQRQREEARLRAEKIRKSEQGLGRLWSWIKKLCVIGLTVAAIGALFVAVAVGFAARSIPSFYQLKTTQNAQTIVVRARDGTEIVELGPSFGQWLDYREIPQTMRDAMIAVEDRRYHMHFGIDPYGLVRAAYVAATGDGRLAATSTITQQLARNIFLNNNRTLDRKAREMVLAMALEWKFSKEQILELYLNKVYFGGGAYGIDSAARKFFSHPARTLSTAEAAIIAGLVKAPSRYSPTADVEAAVERARVVLRLMHEQGYISAADANVDVDAVNLKPERGQNSLRYFTDWVIPQLDLLLPDNFEPIEVWTTIDTGMQRAATASIKANTPGGAQGALVSLDRDGAILAMVGGTDYVESNFNRATKALRQPGSSFKLFVYLAALEAGYKPDSIVTDTPVKIGNWEPRNSNGSNLGDMSLRRAFALSTNTVAAQLGNEVGFGTVASMARRFGVTSQINAYPSMVLGSEEVRLIDMTRAFAAVAARGYSVEPFGITKVTNASGEVLYRHRKRPISNLIPDYVAAGITDLLQDAVANGTGKAAQIERPAAGKTGTTSSNKDGYFVGFSSGVTTGVWMGRDDNRAVRGLQGGRAPARAFAAYMRYAVKDRPIEPFDIEMNLPGWQNEPENESLFGDPDDYFYFDESGNLVQPGTDPQDESQGQSPGQSQDQSQGESVPAEGPPASNQALPAPPPPPSETFMQPDRALDDDFLEQAIGQPLAPEENAGESAPPEQPSPRSGF